MISRSSAAAIVSWQVAISNGPFAWLLLVTLLGAALVLLLVSYTVATPAWRGIPLAAAN